jgi:hypothetical protein
MQSNSGKVLEEVRKMNHALDRQIQVLREGIEGQAHLPGGVQGREHLSSVINAVAEFVAITIRARLGRKLSDGR